MNYKYLSDGRKVIVVGELNNRENIVQEVFVTESGDQIPGGERFVVTSLHSEPVVSYKEKEAKLWEKREQDCRNRINKLEQDEKSISRKLKAMQDILKSSSKLVEILPNEEFERLTMFMSGSVEYVVVHCSYKLERPVKFIEVVQQLDRGGGSVRYEGLKLLSVLGKTDGDLTYRINQYRDGSGMWTTIYPFSTYEAAVVFVGEKARKKLEEGKLSEKDYIMCKEIGVMFTEKEHTTFANLQDERTKEAIEKLKKQELEIKEKIQVAKEKLIH